MCRVASAGLAGSEGLLRKRSDAETKKVGLVMGAVIVVAVETSILSKIASDEPRGAQ